jgi:ribonuclease E
VAIDVNSGRCTSQKELEETALKSNLEAAQEVARQLRLRDLGGLVVIDFIDMRDKKHQKEVEAALKQSLKTDKARVSVGHLSKFGLLELSRQRLRPSAEASAYNPCPTCQGRGRLKTVPTLGLSLLRQISVQVAQNPIQEVRALVPLEVGNFLLNHKRREILALEEQYHLRIVLTSSVGLSPEEIQLEFIKREAEEPKREAPEAKREVAEIKPEAPEAKPEPRKSRRGHRRGPRRGSKRGAKEGPQEAPAQEPPVGEAGPATEPE